LSWNGSGANFKGGDTGPSGRQKKEEPGAGGGVGRSPKGLGKKNNISLKRKEWRRKRTIPKIHSWKRDRGTSENDSAPGKKACDVSQMRNGRGGGRQRSREVETKKKKRGERWFLSDTKRIVRRNIRGRESTAGRGSGQGARGLIRHRTTKKEKKKTTHLKWRRSEVRGTQRKASTGSTG